MEDEAAIVGLLSRVLYSRFVQEASWGAPGLKRLGPLHAPVEGMLKVQSLPWIDRAGLCTALAIYLAEVKGNYPLAVFYLKQSLELKEKELGTDHEETGHALDSLGVCYKAMAMYDESSGCYKAAAAAFARNGSTDSQLRTEHNSAWLRMQRGQYAEAEAGIKGALAAAEISLAADHPLVGCLSLALANSLAIKGELEASSVMLERALSIFNGSAAASAMQQAAHTAGADLAPSAATAADRRARSVRVAAAVQLRGELALAGGRLVEGEKHLLSGLAMLNEQCEQGHLRVICGVVALAASLRAQARTQEAEEILKAARSGIEASRVPTHPLHAAVLAGLAAVCMDGERTEEAEALLRNAANISTEVLGAAHPTTAAILHNLAAAVDASGRLDDAEALYRRALEADTESLGAEHVSVGRTLSALGGVLRRKGQAAEARESFERGHALLRKRLGNGHPETARALANVGCALFDARDFVRAEEVLRAALAVEEETLGPVHLETANTLVNLGAVLGEAGKRDEAVRILRRGAQIYRSTLGPTHMHTRVALGWLKHAETWRGQQLALD